MEVHRRAKLSASAGIEHVCKCGRLEGLPKRFKILGDEGGGFRLAFSRSEHFLSNDQMCILLDLVVFLLHCENTRLKSFAEKLPATFLRLWAVQAEPVQRLKNLLVAVDCGSRSGFVRAEQRLLTLFLRVKLELALCEDQAFVE